MTKLDYALEFFGRYITGYHMIYPAYFDEVRSLTDRTYSIFSNMDSCRQYLSTDEFKYFRSEMCKVLSWKCSDYKEYLMETDSTVKNESITE